MPGMVPTRSCIDTMFSWARSLELKAVIAIGVACTVDSRFSAVTTISSSSPPALAGAPAGAAGPAAAGSARAGPHSAAAASSTAPIDANSAVGHEKAAAFAAHDILFIRSSSQKETTHGGAALIDT